MDAQRAPEPGSDKELWLLLQGLINPAATLAVIGVLTVAAVNLLADFPPLAAARDAILYQHMTEQAYERTLPKMPPYAVRLIAFDDASCDGKGPSGFECQPEGLVDRSKLAETIKFAGEANPAAI